MRTKEKLALCEEGDSIAPRQDLARLIAQETDKRIWELHRELHTITMHPATWELFKVDQGDENEVTYNHFRGVLVVQTTDMPRNHVAFTWVKPA